MCLGTVGPQALVHALPQACTTRHAPKLDGVWRRESALGRVAAAKVSVEQVGPRGRQLVPAAQRGPVPYTSGRWEVVQLTRLAAWQVACSTKIASCAAQAVQALHAACAVNGTH